MIPRIKVGKGITGLANYVLGQGRGAGNDNLAPGEEGRVDWIGGQNFGFDVNTPERADLARRIMEFDALNQASKTRKCEKDAVHLMLSWRVGDKPSREKMEEAARSALKALGMEGAKAFWVAHNDEDHMHLHIVASKINPETGRAYDLKGDQFMLSKWAEQWERDNGGVVCLRRQEANALRDAIDARDPAAVLEAVTRQRATFTEKDLDRALGKQIGNVADRKEFAEQILSQPDIVRLSDTLGGPTTRFTTTAVLADEKRVLDAAATLEGDGRHAVSNRICDLVLNSDAFKTIRDEQRRAFNRAVAEEGLVLIDGQAGTGKSYTMSAIRTAYEASGYNVIGLAPTNTVASDMAKDGFQRASTLHAELFRLKNNRTTWNNRTVVMVDESAMIDTKIMAELTQAARNTGAKLILVGDDRQLSSIERGGMFGALKDIYGAATLSEVARQHKDEDKRAASMMAEGNFSGALEIYEKKGAINWQATQDEARAALVEKWAKDSAASPDKSRFIFSYTNADVKELNLAIREIRRGRGELGEDHMVLSADGWQRFAVSDRIQFTGTDKKQGLYNGTAGTVLAIDGSRITVQIDGKRGDILSFDAAEFQTFRHGYAGTIYRGQGRTLDQTYLYHSEHWRSSASYVALTRHRDKAEIFVATDTVSGRPQSDPWMKATGGADALSHEDYLSAQKSFEKWQEKNPQAAARHGFDSYVKYVQDKWAEDPANKEQTPEEERVTLLQKLARQMARVDDRRAASQFYVQDPERVTGGGFGDNSGDARRFEDKDEGENAQRPSERATHVDSDDVNGQAASVGGSESDKDDDMARIYREIAEAAQEREDMDRAMQRERGRSR